ncbi:hypothetical protein RHSIM_Rhsim01G0155200 [Rhododendron simsii]|uniref:Uncharacterized protein n=1 Tax=Rhododendron simsii TaxID=118357 RepID=A0A834HJN9_RHOSS|nr:hypothetical protein RHSIM_Rhsim01G0155200 [Rhododendron simsii]
MAIALAQGLLLLPDMIKEKESSLIILERITISHGIRSIQKMIEVHGRAHQGYAEVVRLTGENARLLAKNNKLGEKNFKLKDTAVQLGRQLETERRKGKEAEENFAKAMEELEKDEENVRIFEENISEAYDNGFDEASSSTTAVAPVLLDPMTPPALVNPAAQANPIALTYPITPVIDVDQEMIAPVA